MPAHGARDGRNEFDKKGEIPMTLSALLFLVFILGLRHGLDADHLACIDGLTRYNWRMRSPIARWIGMLFSLGHGMVVVGVAVIIGLVSEHFAFPRFFDSISTWVSIVSLFLIGTINTYNLLSSRSKTEHFQLRGFKGKLLPKIARETSNPIWIALTGAMYALAADTVSQTAVWALSAGESGRHLALWLGVIFMAGLVLTDTVDGLIVFRMVKDTSRAGVTASRIMGWLIVVLAYGVSLYDLVTYFLPTMSVDFERVGAFAFFVLLAVFAVLTVHSRSHRRSAAVE
jgi:high-affinity nickel-transport protein